MTELLTLRQTLTVAEVRERMNVSDATVRMWISSKRLPAYVLPGRKRQPIYRIAVDDFNKFLRENKTNGL